MDNFGNSTPGSGPKKVPWFFWFGGTMMAGGLVALAILYSGKNQQVDTLEQDITATRISYNLERDSLLNELRRLSDSCDVLEANNGILGDNLEKEKYRFTRMEQLKDVFIAKEKKYKKDNAALKAASEVSNAENETLRAEIASIRADMESLQKRLAERDRQYAQQLMLFEQQAKRMSADSAKTAAFLDSLWREDVKGYFNNTEIAGAYGLYERNVPYAHFFWGLTTVNGYVINKHWSTGIGLGLLNYDAGLMAPVYLDFKYKFNQGKFTPYVWADGGLMFDLKKFTVPGTLFMNPGAGVYHKINDRWGLNLGVGLFTQSFDIRSSFINIKLGVTFNK